MLETLKKRSKKSSIRHIIIALIIAAGCLIYTKLGILEVIQGPISLPTEENLDSYEGKYVTYDAKYVFGNFVEHTSTNTKTHVTTTTGYGYIIFDPVFQDYFGIKIPKSKSQSFEHQADETYRIFAEEIDDVSTHIKVTGTLKKMDSKYEGYYKDALGEFLDQDVVDSVSTYYIDDETIAGKDAIIVYALTVVAAIAILYAIYIIIRTLNGSYSKYINKYLERHTNLSISNIDSDFSSAKQVGKSVWAGSKWTIYIEGIYAKILSNEDLVWAYYYERTGKHAQSKIITFDKDKNEVSFDISKSDADEVLQIWSSNQPQMIIGYEKDLETTLKKDFATFLNYKYNKAKAMQSDGFQGAYADEFNTNYSSDFNTEYSSEYSATNQTNEN